MNTNHNYHVSDRTLNLDVSRDLRRAGESFDLFIFTRTRLDNGTIRAGRATEVIFKANEERDFGVEFAPLLSLKRDEAQHLMDALWDAGLKPTQGAGSPGQVQAMEENLKDLRRLVFDQPPASPVNYATSRFGAPMHIPAAKPSLWRRFRAWAARGWVS